MIGNIAYPGATNMTYRREDQLPVDASERSLVQRGENLAQKAENVKDFFVSADNTELDSNPEVGVVFIRQAKAPGLMEMSSDMIRGTYRDGKVNATGWRTDMPGAQSNMRIQKNLIFMDRDSHINDSYVGNLESLTTNDDGSYTYGFAYRAFQR